MRPGANFRLRRCGLAWLATAFVACTAPSAEAPPADHAGAVDAAGLADASELAADAGRAAGVDEDAGVRPQTLTVVARAVTDVTSRELALDESNSAIDPQSRFELEFQRLADVRVRLFDESDRAVASTDRMVVGQTTRYTIVPAEQLVTGSRYSLVIDGLKTDLAADERGHPFKVVRIQLKTSGEKPAPPPPPKKRRRSKRR